MRKKLIILLALFTSIAILFLVGVQRKPKNQGLIHLAGELLVETSQEEVEDFADLYMKYTGEWCVANRKYVPRVETNEGIINPVGTGLSLSEDLTAIINGEELFLPTKIIKASGQDIGRMFNLITGNASEVGYSFIICYQSVCNDKSASFGIVICKNGTAYFAAGGLYMNRGLYTFTRQGDGSFALTE